MIEAPPECGGVTEGAAVRILHRGRSLVDPALREAVDNLPGSLRRVAGYHFGWWDAQGVRENRTVSAGGKALRPALALLAAEAVGGAAADALPAATAVELVHNFSLLHDDVMDGEQARRHRPTAWAVFGIGSAILTGDALLALAFDVLAASGHPQATDGTHLLHAAVSDLLEGQGEDLAFELRDDVDLNECLGMARKKTAALVEVSLGLGALFGNGPADRIERLRAFGADLGLAFQLSDDLIGIWGDPAVTGKPVYSDLCRRKRTLPVVAALGSGTAEGARLAQAYRHRLPLSEEDLAELAHAIELAGGRSYCVKLAGQLLGRAMHHLRAAGPITCTAELAALARLSVDREC